MTRKDTQDSVELLANHSTSLYLCLLGLHVGQVPEQEMPAA